MNGDDMLRRENDRMMGTFAAQIANLQKAVDALAHKVDGLVALQNRGSGAMWALTVIASALGAAGSAVFHRFFGH